MVLARNIRPPSFGEGARTVLGRKLIATVQRTPFRPRDPREDAENAARDAEAFEHDIRCALERYRKSRGQ